MIQKIFAGLIGVLLILTVIFAMGPNIENTANTANFTNTTTTSFAEMSGWIIPVIAIAAVILAVIGWLKAKKGKGTLAVTDFFSYVILGDIYFLTDTAKAIKRHLARSNIPAK